VFKVPEKTAETLKADLEAVKIPYVDDAGRYADFHALRHSTGSLLAASGAHPKVVQSIMRHSDINLTMNRYTHIFRGQESEAVAGLPDLSLPSKQGKKEVATGTDDMPVDSAYKPAYKKL
jgi:integrase